VSQRPSVLGIDVGTSGCKATLIEPDGRVAGTGYATYELRRPQPEWVEIDPNQWLAALRDAVGQAASGGGPGVQAIGLSSANATVLVDTDGRPVMPAIMQLDRRSRAEIRGLRATLGDDALLERTGNIPGAGVSWLATLAWLQNRRPEALARTQSILFPGGYVALQMTGTAAVDPSRASTTGLFDPRQGAWCPELAAAVGVAPAQLPIIADSDEVIGRLRPSVAAALGLRAGIPVVAGVMDSVASALSVRAVEPGDALVILGTMARTVAVSHGFTPRETALTARHAVPSRWISMNVLWGAGRHIAAAASLWSGHPDYARLAREVPTIAPGCDGLRFIASADSGLDGLEQRLSEQRPDHTPAHVARAVIEGVLCEVLGPSPPRGERRQLALSGGPTRAPAVPQILADMTGRSVAVPAVQASESLGAAICSAGAAGLVGDVRTAMISMTGAAQRFEPSPHAHRAYRALAGGALAVDA
jgi:xylulokinase